SSTAPTVVGGASSSSRWSAPSAKGRRGEASRTTTLRASPPSSRTAPAGGAGSAPATSPRRPATRTPRRCGGRRRGPRGGGRGADVEPGGVEGVGRERVAQHGEPGVLLGQPVLEAVPRRAAVARAVHAE